LSECADFDCSYKRGEQIRDRKEEMGNGVGMEPERGNRKWGMEPERGIGEKSTLAVIPKKWELISL
jgi:hypothetical protein